MNVLLESISAAASVAYVVLAGAGAGHWLSRRMPQSLRPAERMALRVLGGLGILGLVLFLIGNIRLLPAVIGLVLAAPAGYCVWSAFRNRGLVPRIRLVRPRLGVLCAAAILLVVLVSALDVPIGTSDDISYHLLGPTLWLRDGRVQPRADNFATSFPGTVEMLFAAAIGLSNSRAAGLVTLVFGSILLVQVWGIARRLGASASVADLAVLLAATMPALMDNVGVAFVDVPFGCFALAGARIILDRANLTHVVAAGMFVGAAIGTKYTGLFVLAATAALVLLRAQTSGSFRRRLGDAAVLSLVSCAVGGAWYLRNFIQIGTPIYPPPAWLARFVSVKGMYPGAVQAFQDYVLAAAGGKFGRGLIAFLLLPFRLTYDFSAFWGWYGSLGIAPLAFVPIAILALWHDRFAGCFLLWGLLLTICWFSTAQISRFLLPVFALLPALSAIGASQILQRTNWTARMLVQAVIATSVAHGAYVVVAQHWTRLRDVLSPTYATATRAKNPFAKAFDYLNAHSEVRDVLILEPVKSYYLNKPYLIIRGEYGEQAVDGVSDIRTALPRLGELGTTHVLDVRHPDFAVQPDGRLKLVFQTTDARIFQVQLDGKTTQGRP